MPISLTTVTVGAGGTGGGDINTHGKAGGSSSFGDLSALGGGGGASYNASYPSAACACGGGAAVDSKSPASVAKLGGNGGKVTSGSNCGGGGGGMSGDNGGDATATVAGTGAEGLSCAITGDPLVYGSGGGGGVRTGTATPGAGGTNAGAGGANQKVGENGNAGFGGGGGGGGGGTDWSNGKKGGTGGSGAVIVRVHGKCLVNGEVEISGAIVEKTVYVGGQPPEDSETMDDSPVADKEYSFTADEYKMSDRQLYACCGYTLATSEDGIAWSEEGALVKANAYSFTYRSAYVRITWHYELAGYELTAGSKEEGVVISCSSVPLFGSAYTLDEDVTFTAPATSGDGAAKFARWRGDTADGADVATASVTVKADRARTLTAVYAKDWSWENHVMTDGDWQLALVIDKGDNGYLNGITDLTPSDTRKDLDLSKPILDANGKRYHIRSLNGNLGNLATTGRLILPDDGYLTDLGNYAFRESRFTGTIVIPASVQKAGSQMFWGCKGVEAVEFKTSSLKELPAESFCGCKNLERLIFPEGFAFKVIGKSAFSGCVKLAEVDPMALFSEVETIDESAFFQFQKEVATGALATVELPAVKTVGKLAFAEAIRIEEISFGKGLTRLGVSNAQWYEGVFYLNGGGMRLRKVVFASDPSSALTPYLFQYCLNLNEIRWGKAAPPAMVPTAFFGNGGGLVQNVTNYVRAANGWTDVDWRSDKAPYRLGSAPESKFGTWVWGNGKGSAQGLTEGAFVYLAAEATPGLLLLIK